MGSGKDTIGKLIRLLAMSDGSMKWYDEALSLDTPEDFIDNKSVFKIKKFADKLKDIVCLLIGCTREELEDPEFKEMKLGSEWNLYQFGHQTDEIAPWSHVFDGDFGPMYQTYTSMDEAVEQFKSWVKCSYDEDYEDQFYIRTFKMTPRKLLQLIGTECGRNIIHPNIWVNASMSGYSGESNWIFTDVRFPNEADAIRNRGGILIRTKRFMELETKAQHPSETALDNYTDWDYVIENTGSIEELTEKVRQILIRKKIIKYYAAKQ